MQFFMYAHIHTHTYTLIRALIRHSSRDCTVKDFRVTHKSYDPRLIRQLASRPAAVANNKLHFAITATPINKKQMY